MGSARGCRRVRVCQVRLVRLRPHPPHPQHTPGPPCSGYTAKVAGTEVGVTEPEATFSSCFGSAFLMWHPTK